VDVGLDKDLDDSWVEFMPEQAKYRDSLASLGMTALKGRDLSRVRAKCGFLGFASLRSE